MWQQANYLGGGDSGINSGATTQAPSLTGKEDDMETADMMFDPNYAGYSQGQVDGECGRADGEGRGREGFEVGLARVNDVGLFEEGWAGEREGGRRALKLEVRRTSFDVWTRVWGGERLKEGGR